MTMMAVTSRASAAPILCSRLLWRMNVKRSRNAALGLTGRGNQDIGRKWGWRGATASPEGKSAVELEAQRDHFGRGDRVAVVHRRLVAPVGDQVPAGRCEKSRIGTSDRINGNDAPACVDGELEAKRRFLSIVELR